MIEIVINCHQITTAVLIALTLIYFIGRLYIRFATRRRLFLDNGFLILSVACLCGATDIIFRNLFLFVLIHAIFEIPKLLFTTAFLPHISSILSNQRPWNSFAFLIFTSIFSVHGCYLSFFKPLIR